MPTNNRGSGRSGNVQTVIRVLRSISRCLVAGKDLTLILPAVLRSARSKVALLMKLQENHQTGQLHKNVILNTDRNSSFSHIEFTPDTVRLEFLSSQDPTYRLLAKIATDDNPPEALTTLISDVKNLDFCGETY